MNKKAMIWSFIAILPLLMSCKSTTPNSPEISESIYRILYISAETGRHHIFRVDGDGKFKVNLTPTLGNCAAPSFSEDGSKLVFTADRDVYIMDTQTESIQRLTNTTAEEFYPKISPDLKKVVFCRRPDYPDPKKVFEMNIDGTSVQQLTFNDDASMPQYSNDGNYIIYNGKSDKRYYVVSINRESNKIKILSDTTKISGYRFNSKVNNRLYFSVTDGGIYARLYTMKIDGTDHKILTDGTLSFFWPIQSPDGKQIVFSCGGEQGTKHNIGLIDADGQNYRIILEYEETEWNPKFSPDSKKIVFKTTWNYRDDIYLIDSDGSNLIKLVDDDYIGSWQFYPMLFN